MDPTKKRVNLRPTEILEVCQRPKLQFFEGNQDKLSHCLAALVQPKVGSKHHVAVGPQLKPLVDLVAAALYNFSKGKLLRFLDVPEFSIIVLHFLRKPGFIETIGDVTSKAEA